jgi:hypothetical protein
MTHPKIQPKSHQPLIYLKEILPPPLSQQINFGPLTMEPDIYNIHELAQKSDSTLPTTVAIVDEGGNGLLAHPIFKS